MIGITGLVDTLLAAKLSQRLDQLGLKSAVEVPAAQPAVPVQKADNDVRLPSHAALDRQIAGGHRPALPQLAQPLPSSSARLSAAARVISAVLAEPESGDAGPVRGTAPLWPSSQIPASSALATTLAQTLSASGLFYESHLLEFTAGRRSLDQLAQEPQARWAAPASPSPQSAAPAAGQGAPLAPLADVADVSDAAARSATLPPHAPTPSGAVPVPSAGTSAGAPAADRPAAAVSSGPAFAEVVHPHAVALVHQQLDLLATAVFRWSGQAWPGVPMDWSVREEEPADRGADTPRGDEAFQRRWTTTVSLDLPRLGVVDVQLSLAGAALHAALAADDAAALARLRDAGGGLAQRLESAGLRLDELKIVPRRQP